MQILPDLQSVVEITRQAGKILLEKFESEDLEVGLKGAEEIVTEADRASEAYLLDHLRDLFPGSGFFGEETGFHEGENGFVWVVDPLDGTHNFSIGVPLWGCSVGLLDSNRVPVTGVLDFPTLKKTFWASRGEGAFRDGHPIEVESGPLNPNSNIGVQSRVRLDPFPDHIEKISRQYCCRSFGAIAYHAILIATGKMRATVDFKVKLHDIAAATVIIEEAGGITCDVDGKPIFPLEKNYPDLVDYPLPFFAGDPETGPAIREELFPQGTPEAVVAEHAALG